jgi:hypothetical protein
MTNVPESMFPPGSTPYGPPAGGVPAASVPATVAAPQPYVTPPAAWVSTPAPPRPIKNGFGVAAVWIGAFALPLSFSGLSLSWFFILLALIFGIIAIARTGRPRTAATIGLSLTGLALLIGIIVTVTRF